MPSNKKPSKFPVKIKNALLAAAGIVMALYTVALFLPNPASMFALLLGVLIFLLMLYFDRDYRFFRVGSLALFMFGLQKLIPHLSQLNIAINPDSFLFQLSSAENTVGAYDYSLLIIAIVGFALDFLREKEAFVLSSNLTKILIWGMAFGVIALSVPSSIFSNNQINLKGDNIKVESGGTVNIGSLDQKLAEELNQRLKENNENLKKTVNPNERRLLETEIKALNEKLTNTEKTLKEEKQLRKKTLQTIKQLKAEIPSKQLKKAQKALQEKGDIKLAEQAFDSIVKKGSGPVAQAAFQSGEIAESRVDYAKAIAQYTIAVTLDKNNPDYLLKAGTMARTLGDYSSAQQWLERLLSIREKEGKKSINLAMAQHVLAILYNDQSKYKAAELLDQRSLKITEKEQGKDHFNVAMIFNGLAELSREQGKYKVAEPLYQRSLKIKEKVLGRDHPSVATTLSNLALLYTLQGKYKEAEPLYQRSLKIREKALERDLPDVATTLNNLAGLYYEQGKYKEAEPLYQRSLEIREKVLRKDHPDMAMTLNGLAELYRVQGKYKAAEPLYQQSLKITEKALGRDHPSVATSLNNLAVLYYEKDKYKEAELLYQRTIQILEKTFPEGHPNIETTKANYNILKQKMAKNN